jgi:AcrR family transcriptional regulator
MTVETQRKPGRPRDEALQSRRREEILDAAAILFAERGYPNTDVDSVAERLGVGKGTVYRYFPSKSDLFLAAVARGMTRLDERIHEQVDHVADPLEKIERAIYTYLAYFDEHPELVELFIQERAEFKDRGTPVYFEHRKASMGPWQKLFRGLIAAGRIRDLDVDRTGDVMNGLMYGTIIQNTMTGRRGIHKDQASRIVDIVFNGILTSVERKRRKNF